MKISYRAIKVRDFEFLWGLHNLALRKYVEDTWGWNEAWQKKKFQAEFDPAKGKIITIDGEDAGYLWIIEKEKETLIASIRLLPKFQGKGAGTRIIENLLLYADKDVTLRVLRINPAQNLYKRLGFKIESASRTHYLMRFKSNINNDFSADS